MNDTEHVGVLDAVLLLAAHQQRLHRIYFAGTRYVDAVVAAAGRRTGRSSKVRKEALTAMIAAGWLIEPPVVAPETRFGSSWQLTDLGRAARLSFFARGRR